ncbi:MAG TPA: biotin--[acetyl-CoA-carboxylase] ligase [Candidatus Limnocylindrales bacterium]|nr:biotin--[acetyl-CoA-carboxylase] ligase [Candidatus Limnocylindrales bacterium]
MTFLSRSERFAVVGSTNDVVRDWLAAGTPEVCLAVAGEQTAGRGRDGRAWIASPGAAVLLSVGFRPTWLAPDAVWRLAAIVSLAMAEAAEAVAGLATGTIRLKWPNDLVLVASDGVRKLAGVLGETDGLGAADPRAVIGVGINTGWGAAAFPPDLTGSMTSLTAATERPVDDDALVLAFARGLEARTTALRAGSFDAPTWAGRQVTTGRTIRIERPDRAETVRATGVDPVTGGLLVDDAASGATRAVLVGEVVHVRLADPIAEAV